MEAHISEQNNMLCILYITHTTVYTFSWTFLHTSFSGNVRIILKQDHNAEWKKLGNKILFLVWFQVNMSKESFYQRVWKLTFTYSQVRQVIENWSNSEEILTWTSNHGRLDWTVNHQQWCIRKTKPTQVVKWLGWHLPDERMVCHTQTRWWRFREAKGEGLMLFLSSKSF